jgi:hypothetical protein
MHCEGVGGICIPGCSILYEVGARERSAACRQADEVNFPPVEGNAVMAAEVKAEQLYIQNNRISVTTTRLER